MGQFIEFKKVDNKYLETSLEKQLTQTKSLIISLEQLPESSWQEVVEPLQESLYQLNQIWGLVGHLQSVNDSKSLRELHDKFLPLVTDLYVSLGQNQAIFRHIQTIKDQQYTSLNHEQQRVIDNELRDFRLSGITLPTHKQQEFKELQTRLSELSTKFEHNVLDATDNYAKLVNKEELIGIPEDNLAFYQAQATKEEQSGYKITLHIPSYLPIMQFASNRELRKELYYAYVTRASELGANTRFDNSDIIRQILRLRQQKAQLLEFGNYAELSLFNKMAETPEQVLNFLYQLAEKSKHYAQEELAELATFAQELDNITDLSAWDIPYYSEKLRQHKYSYSSHELKQYFPLPKVLDGLFSLIKQLYKLDFINNPQVSTWHPDVTTYDVILNGNTIGHIYYDLYAREGKQPGAWMNSAQDRKVSQGQTKLPIAYVICNFTAPLANKPSLLTFDEVQTLFHEMGHALHHLMTVIDNPSISGINGVEWDAVELPSQFMEYFTWDYTILSHITQNINNGESLPYDLYQKILASRHFQSGLQMLRQLEFAIFDLSLHSSFDYGKGDYLDKLNEIRKEIAVVIPPEYNRFANSFSHIFAGGYAAGYYSYKWAEVLACDVFSSFDGLSGPELSTMGEKFRKTILSQGGIRPMMDNFKAFMGREPKIDALLKYSGMS